MTNKKQYIIKVTNYELDNCVEFNSNDIKKCLAKYLTYVGTQINAADIIQDIATYLKILDTHAQDTDKEYKAEIERVCEVLAVLNPRMKQENVLHDRLMLYRIMTDYINNLINWLPRTLVVTIIKEIINKIIDLEENITFEEKG